MAHSMRSMTAERLDLFAAAWLRCDLEELRDFLTNDAIYSPLSGDVVRGREAVTRRFAETLADDGGSELRFEPAVVAGTLGACRWHMCVRTADGASFEIDGLDLYEFEGDRIRSKDVYQKA
jgi:ketosteroid isomerase-like protein